MRKKPKFSEMYSPSADVIGGNEDFLSQIFPHLPVKSLSRFKSVSKQWLALISHRDFCLSHACKNPSCSIPYGIFFYNPRLIDLWFCNYFSTDESNNSVSPSNSLSGQIPAFPDHSIYSVSLSGSVDKMPSCSNPDDVSIQTTMELLPGENTMKMVQSCNGLNLFQFNTSDQGIKLYCVRNLATNQLKMVPLPKLYDDHPIVTCNLAFDPLASPHYKIVCVKGGGISFGSRILIYSSETGNWKDTNVPRTGMSVKFAKGVYCQGAIYWVGNDFSSSYCYRFDIEAEKFTKISMPARQRGGNLYFKYFGEFNGRLNLVCSRNFAAAKLFSIYELDQVSENWFVKFRVNISRLTSSFPEVVVKGLFNDSQYAFSILCVVSGARDEDSSLVMTILGKVVSYNLKSKRVEVLSELPSLKQMNFHGSNAYPFVPTLYPV